MLMGMAEILNKTSALKTKEEKINYLRHFGNNVAFKTMLKMAFDKNLEWDLPPGEPPYKSLPESVDQHGMLYQEMKRMYLFHKGGHPTLKPVRKEMMFVQILESVQPHDAKLILAVKEKNLPKVFKGITEKLVDEAFPGLLVYN